jgi:hypothetical protein
MPDLHKRKTTKREFLKILGLSSTSLLSFGALADELLAEVQMATIPVASIIRPNAFQSGRGGWFSVMIVFPIGYKAADVDVSTVRCEGARALDSILHPDGRTIIFLCDSDHLRKNLPCGFSVPFTITGQLSGGSGFDVLDSVAVIGAEQSTIYHTSTRKRKSCRACKSHALNRIYSSEQAADNNRAHLGCNCRIVEEKIGWQNYLKAFWPTSRVGRTVYDRRWGWPPPLPTGLSLECPSALREHLRRG